jgi:hypothetical protein
MMRPKPTFAEVRSMLQWANHAHTNKESRPQVFVAAPWQSQPNPAMVGQTAQFPATAAPAG